MGLNFSPLSCAVLALAKSRQHRTEDRTEVRKIRLGLDLGLSECSTQWGRKGGIRGDFVGEKAVTVVICRHIMY